MNSMTPSTKPNIVGWCYVEWRWYLFAFFGMNECRWWNWLNNVMPFSVHRVYLPSHKLLQKVLRKYEIILNGVMWAVPTLQTCSGTHTCSRATKMLVNLTQSIYGYYIGDLTFNCPVYILLANYRAMENNSFLSTTFGIFL